MKLSPKQIVAVVVAVCAAVVLTPVAVGAATASWTNIVDPYNAAHKARVTPKGQLWVVEADPVTRTLGRVSSGGKRLVGDGSGALTVDGSVSAVPVAPATPWNQNEAIEINTLNTRQPLHTAITPAKLALTSMTFAGEASGTGPVQVRVVVYRSSGTSGDCDTLLGGSFTETDRFTVVVPAGQTVNLTWPTPLVYPTYSVSGQRFCVNVEVDVPSAPTSYGVHVAASGFRY